MSQDTGSFVRDRRVRVNAAFVNVTGAWTRYRDEADNHAGTCLTQGWEETPRARLAVAANSFDTVPPAAEGTIHVRDSDAAERLLEA